jgi:hypothetical protein
VFLIGSSELNLWGKAISRLVAWHSDTHSISLHLHIINLVNIRCVIIVKVALWVRWLITAWSSGMSLDVFIAVRKLIMMFNILLIDFIKRTWPFLIPSLKRFLLLMISYSLVYITILRIHLKLLIVMIPLILLIWRLEYVTESINCLLIIWVLIEYWPHWI